MCVQYHTVCLMRQLSSGKASGVGYGIVAGPFLLGRQGPTEVVPLPRELAGRVREEEVPPPQWAGRV